MESHKEPWGLTGPLFKADPYVQIALHGFADSGRRIFEEGQRTVHVPVLAGTVDRLLGFRVTIRYLFYSDTGIRIRYQGAISELVVWKYDCSPEGRITLRKGPYLESGDRVYPFVAKFEMSGMSGDPPDRPFVALQAFLYPPTAEGGNWSIGFEHRKDVGVSYEPRGLPNTPRVLRSEPYEIRLVAYDIVVPPPPPKPVPLERPKISCRLYYTEKEVHLDSKPQKPIIQDNRAVLLEFVRKVKSWPDERIVRYLRVDQTEPDEPQLSLTCMGYASRTGLETRNRDKFSRQRAENVAEFLKQEKLRAFGSPGGVLPDAGEGADPKAKVTLVYFDPTTWPKPR